jgi:endoglucanase
MTQWKWDEAAWGRFKQLLNTISPSSCEMRTASVVRERMREAGAETQTDSLGNVWSIFNPEAPFRVAVTAHMDEVGLQVTSISEEGLLRFRKIGGVKASSLPGQRVAILADSGIVEGVVACDPLKDNETEAGYTVRTDDLWIDIGVNNRSEAEAKVAFGDFAGFYPSISRIGQHRIVSKGLDNKAGVFVMLEAIARLGKENLPIGVCGMAIVQEEIHARGIEPATNRLSPDTAFVVDVDYATDTPTDGKERFGGLALGGGVGLTINADNNPVLIHIVETVAGINSLPIQKTLSREISGGTDAKAMQLCTKGVACVNVNIPNRYMHTSVEMCDLRDVETAINLIVDSVRHIARNEITTFRPGID